MGCDLGHTRIKGLAYASIMLREQYTNKQRGTKMKNAIAGVAIAVTAFTAAGLVAYGVGMDDGPPPIKAAVVIQNDHCTEDLIEYSDKVIQRLGYTLKLSSEVPTASKARLDDINDQLDAGMDQYLEDLQNYNDTVDRCGGTGS